MKQHEILCDVCKKKLGQANLPEHLPPPRGFVCGGIDEEGSCAQSWQRQRDESSLAEKREMVNELKRIVVAELQATMK